VSAAGLPFLDLTPGDDAGEIRAALDRVLARGWFVLGPELEAFEVEFARACGARYAVGVASGTDAIALLLRAAGVAAGDSVLIPALTAGFTGLAVLAIGAAPVVVDVDPDTLTIDLDACEAGLSPSVKAIVPVHLYGQPADLDAVHAFARRHAIAVIEDCCQAHLATWKGEPVGTRGTGGAFSFYPTKNLGALGDGGAIVTNDESVADRIRLLRNGGQRPRHHHAEAGINSRLDELQAAVLRVRLRRLPELTARRRAIAATYRRELAPAIRMPPELDPGHVYHLFPVRPSRRDPFRQQLAASGIETLVHYPLALPDQRVFASYTPAPCPAARRAADEVVSLPLRPSMTDGDVDRVVRAVQSASYS
jgi:dTDP-3-amino-3,4,6-trideoxy-alpha-D-glucose transaminase